MSTDPSTAPEPRTAGLHLHRWTDRAVVGVAITTFASGFGQFGVVAALGDVARGFGNVTHGATFADQAGLSGTELGIGLAIIRLASLGGLPITGLADRFGRRKMLLITVGAGLVSHRAGRGQPQLLVVRGHLRLRASAAQRHQWAGAGHRGRTDRLG